MANGAMVTWWTGCSLGSSWLPIENVPPGSRTISGQCSQSRKTLDAGRWTWRLVGGTTAATWLSGPAAGGGAAPCVGVEGAGTDDAPCVGVEGAGTDDAPCVRVEGAGTGDTPCV